MAKKVFGYIFWVIGGLVALSLIMWIPVCIASVFVYNKEREQEIVDIQIIEQLVGSVVILILSLGLSITLLWFARKWTKKAVILVEENILDQ